MRQQRTQIRGDGSHYIGKRLLVGITCEDHTGKPIRQEQFHGLIVEASEHEIVVERSDTGKRKSLPPELAEAPKGQYRLRATGEIVVDPDYVATWVLKQPAPAGEDEAAG